jgi:hypothetical protein
MSKLLHAPTVELKRALESPNGLDLVKAARALFDLGAAGAEETAAAATPRRDPASEQTRTASAAEPPQPTPRAASGESS